MSNNGELTRNEALALSRIPGVSTYRVAFTPEKEKVYVIMYKTVLQKGTVKAVSELLGDRMHRFEKLGDPTHGPGPAKLGFKATGKNRSGTYQ